jgi:RimJ/RimL family protein N-acetyltransferase
MFYKLSLFILGKDFVFMRSFLFLFITLFCTNVNNAFSMVQPDEAQRANTPAKPAKSASNRREKALQNFQTVMGSTCNLLDVDASRHLPWEEVKKIRFLTMAQREDFTTKTGEKISTLCLFNFRPSLIGDRWQFKGHLNFFDERERMTSFDGEDGTDLYRWGEPREEHPVIVDIYYSIDPLTKANQRHIMSCCVQDIWTTSSYQNKGFATYAIRRLAKIIFTKTRTDLIVASVGGRAYSQKAFERCGFSLAPKASENRCERTISLDGGQTYFQALFDSNAEGNFYLSRYTYEAQNQNQIQKQNLLKALRQNATEIRELGSPAKN